MVGMEVVYFFLSPNVLNIIYKLSNARIRFPFSIHQSISAYFPAFCINHMHAILKVYPN